MANLVVDGKNHGIQAFVVQLRDLKDHMPMKGASNKKESNITSEVIIY